MKRLGTLLAIAIVLSLLVAATVPVGAGKPDQPPGQAKEKEKGEKAPPGQQKKGDQEPSRGPKPAADDPEPDGEVDEAQEKVVICHKGKKTLVVAKSAVAAHMAHGDTAGPCPGMLTPPEVAPSEPISPTLIPSGTVKITICHKPGTPAEHTLVVAAPAWKAHQAHGDYIGPCEPPSEPISPTLVPSPTVMVTICHKYGSRAEKTMQVPESAVPGHQRHGDFIGSCDEPPDALPTISGKTWICHKAGTPWEMTLLVSDEAVEEHVMHEDTIGPCGDWATSA
jgi:hypothetical protein